MIRDKKQQKSGDIKGRKKAWVSGLSKLKLNTVQASCVCERRIHRERVCFKRLGNLKVHLKIKNIHRIEKVLQGLSGTARREDNK